MIHGMMIGRKSGQSAMAGYELTKGTVSGDFCR